MSISTHLQVATANQDAKDQKLGVYSNSSFAHEAENNDKLLWDLWLSRYHLAIVAFADKINLFAIVNNILDKPDINFIANALNINPQGVTVLVYFLVNIGLIKYAHNKVSLTATAKRYLVPDSPYYWGIALINARETNEYNRILKAMTEKTPQLHINDKNISLIWETGEIDSATAEIFTQVMHSTIYNSVQLAVSSNAFSGVTNLLDVGGGSGCFAEAFVNFNLQACAIIFELPTVCNIINNRIKNHRISTYSGNFFKDDFPPNCDGVLFSNILHDWSIDRVKVLLDKSFRALPTNGKIFIHEMLLNENKCGPLTATVFNLLMYINHGSQQFTKSELYKLLEGAGFTINQHIPTHPYYSLIIAEKSHK